MLHDIRVISDIIKTNLVDDQICNITFDDFDIFSHENCGSNNPIILDRSCKRNTVTDKYRHKGLTIITQYDPECLANSIDYDYIEHNVLLILHFMKQHCNVLTLKDLVLVLLDIMNSSYSLDALLRVLHESNIKVTFDNHRDYGNFINYHNIRCLMFSLIYNVRSHVPFAWGSIINITHDIDKIDIVSIMLLIQMQKIRDYDPIKNTVIFLLSLIESVTIR